LKISWGPSVPGKLSGADPAGTIGLKFLAKIKFTTPRCPDAEK